MELKPCPFCGGDGKIVEHKFWKIDKPTFYTVICKNFNKCRTLNVKSFPTKEEAAEAWNIRADFKEESIKPRGKWLQDDSPYTVGSCSNCGCSPVKRTMSNMPWHYCPNCGAKMDG